MRLAPAHARGSEGLHGRFPILFLSYSALQRPVPGASMTGSRDSPHHRHLELCISGRAAMKEVLVLRPSSFKEGLGLINRGFLPERSHLPE